MNLFKKTLNSSDFQSGKFANYRLSGDSTRWTSDILNYVQTEFPMIENQPMSLKFTQKDDEMGYAIGSVVVGKDNFITLPIIVEDFVLKPVDVAVIGGGKTIPFTEETVKTLFTQKSAFSNLVENDEVDSIERLFNRELVDITSVDKYGSYKPSLKEGLFSKIANSVPHEDVQELVDRINADPVLADTFRKNNTYDILDEMLEATKGNSKVAVTDKVASVMNRDIFMLEKTGKFEYSLHTGNSAVDDKRIIKVAASKMGGLLRTLFGEEYQEEIPDILGQPLIKEGKKKCKKKLQKPKSHESSESSEAMESEKHSAWAPIVNFDGTNTMTVMGFDLANGDKIDYITFGVNEFEKFAKMRTQENKESGLFHMKRTDRFANKSLPAEKAVNMDLLKGTEPERGMTGVIKIGNKVTKPITIEKTAKFNRRYFIEASDGLTKYSFEVIRGIDEIVPGETKNNFFLPKNAEFIEVGSVMEETHDWSSIGMHKTSNWVVAADNRFYFGGKEFEKYGDLGHKLEDVSPFDAKWIMLQCGVSEEDMTKAATMKNGRHYFSEVKAPISLTEYSQKANKKLAEIFDPASDAELDLVKEAAVMEDRNTVDSILSLNYLNKDNLQEYVMNIPVIEQTLSVLAQLVLSIRLGLKEIPEEAAKRAMYSLTKVLEKLYQLGVFTK